VALSSIKKISKKKAKRCKKKKKEKAAPQKQKRGREEKKSEVLTSFLVPLLSCILCLLKLGLIRV
jgi:hypothetical protein